MVLLTKSDYIEKMRTILEDDSKFVHIGDAETKDRTTQQERALQAFLLRALKKGDISRDVYDRVRPSGSMRPRMYGVPKLHKDGVPLRPILSMINSPQHELAKWLTEVLASVAQKFGQHQVNDSFEFCEHIDKFMELHQDCSSVYMCSFDVVSLFTNVPLHEVIQICLNTLFRDEDVVAPPLPEELIKKLLYIATSEVEFFFNG